MTSFIKEIEDPVSIMSSTYTKKIHDDILLLKHKNRGIQDGFLESQGDDKIPQAMEPCSRGLLESIDGLNETKNMIRSFFVNKSIRFPHVYTFI